MAGAMSANPARKVGSPPRPAGRMAPRRPLTARPAAPPRPPQRALVVDQKNMLLLWLEEKIARHEMTAAQADEMVKDAGSAIKNWVSPAKDALGSAQLFKKMATDFASWKGAKVVYSRSSAGHQLVTFKGWPANRSIVRGTRYRVDHPKMIELQIGKPGLRAAAKDSARFGVYLVVAVDIADYLMRDKATLGELLGTLTVDIPGVLLASAVGAAAGSAVAGTALGTALVVGSFALGPMLVAFVVGVAVGYALSQIDSHYKIGEKLGKAYDAGLDRLAEIWDDLGDGAELRYRQLMNSQMIHDLDRNIDWLTARIAKYGDRVSGTLSQLW